MDWRRLTSDALGVLSLIVLWVILIAGTAVIAAVLVQALTHFDAGFHKP